MRFACVAEHFDQLEATSKRNEMIAILAVLFVEAGNATEITQLAYLIQGRVAPTFEQVEFGMGEALVAEALAQALDQPKDEIAAQFARLGDYGLVAAELHADDAAPEGQEVSAVFETLKQIAHTAGAGSVAQKTELLADLLRQASASEAKHLARIPLGRLRLGIGDPTVMDALSFARIESMAARHVSLSIRPTSLSIRPITACSDGSDTIFQRRASLSSGPTTSAPTSVSSHAPTGTRARPGWPRSRWRPAGRCVRRRPSGYRGRRRSSPRWSVAPSSRR